MLEAAAEFAEEFWAVLGEMAPYLLFGFLAAGLLSVFVSPGLVERHLGGRGLGPLVKASAFGVPLPLCSCGVIPVAASLRRHGASRGATTSFLLSTPQTGVDSIMVTLSLLGPVFAVFRPVVAFVTGLVGGGLVSAVAPEEGGKTAGREACHAECCEPTSSQGKLARGLAYGFVTLAGDIGWALLAGLLIAGLISALLPENFFAPVLGGGIVAMIVMMLAGIPIYVCATASVPVAAALIAKGASPGAALVFLMTGPATNAATIAVVGRTMGRKTAVTYLLTVAGCALGAGMLLDGFFAQTGGRAAAPHAWMMPEPIKAASAFVLLGVLANALLRRREHEDDSKPHATAAERRELRIEGMTCSHCVAAVRGALERMPGVDEADVSLKNRSAVVRGSNLNATSLIKTIEELGYRAAAKERNTDEGRPENA